MFISFCLEFAKEPLTGIDKTCQNYHLTNAAGDLQIFGNLVTENDEEKMVVVGIDTNKDMVATNLKPVSGFDENLLWYRIDAKTYGKAQKMHDMIDHTLATMLLSYLKRG